jgi:lysophospholipase L1-like esterase
MKTARVWSRHPPFPMSLPLAAALLALVVFAPFVPKTWAADKPHNFSKWESAIAAFETADQAQPPPKGAIVFIGSSSIVKWKTLAEDFPHHRVVNRGFGGSEIIDSVHFADRILIPYAPRLVVLYAGGNDINAGKTPDQVFADFQAFAELLRRKLPDTDLDYISIAGNPARWAQVERVKAANAKIEAFMDGKPHLKFINVFPQMLGADGQPIPEIFGPDKLHMSPAGYKLWTKILLPFLPPPDQGK